MNIGDEEETVFVEPLEIPVPQHQPAEEPQEEPVAVPEEEPETVGVRVRRSNHVYSLDKRSGGAQ